MSRSTSTTATDLAEHLSRTRQAAEKAKARLLGTFAYVPDDKLHWSPSETARTPLWMVAHCGMANHAFAAAIRGEDLPLAADPQEAARQIRNAGRDIATREEAVRLLEDSTAEVIRALGTVTPERLGSHTQSPFGPVPLTVWVDLPAVHMDGHAHQLDYLQTIWGDLEDHG